MPRYSQWTNDYHSELLWMSAGIADKLAPTFLNMKCPFSALHAQSMPEQSVLTPRWREPDSDHRFLGGIGFAFGPSERDLRLNHPELGRCDGRCSSSPARKVGSKV